MIFLVITNEFLVITNKNFEKKMKMQNIHNILTTVEATDNVIKLT
jgi:hypothetical protein